jgi:hypothetical protein
LFHLAAFAKLLDETNCPCRVAVLEENLCQAHFTRALADAFASNALQRLPLMAMQATSQLWSRAGNFNDGCGEGHIYTLPNQTWLSPPGWASQMLFTTFQPNALAVQLEATRCGMPQTAASGCVDVFASASTSGEHITLRMVNSGNASRAVSLRLVGAPNGTGAVVAAEAELLSLTSPLSANQTAYLANRGGVNPVFEPLRISMHRSRVPFDPAKPWLLPAQSFQVLLLKSVASGEGQVVLPSNALADGSDPL